jgi:hypothetical protein
VPFRWINSALTGEEKRVTTVPDWLVSVKLFRVRGN